MKLTGLGYALALALLWVVLALMSSTTTYHLAPLLVAATPPLLGASREAEQRGKTLLLATAGVAIAGVATLGLSLAGSLSGPSLLPVGGAALESVVFSLAGAGLGVVGRLVVRNG